MSCLILPIPSVLESKVLVQVVENMVITSEIVLEQVVILQHLRVHLLPSQKLDSEIAVPKKSRMRTGYSLHSMMIPTNLMMRKRKCFKNSRKHWRS
jgi:hypothetical protein